MENYYPFSHTTSASYTYEFEMTEFEAEDNTAEEPFTSPGLIDRNSSTVAPRVRSVLDQLNHQMDTIRSIDTLIRGLPKGSPICHSRLLPIFHSTGASYTDEVQITESEAEDTTTNVPFSLTGQKFNLSQTFGPVMLAIVAQINGRTSSIDSLHAIIRGLHMQARHPAKQPFPPATSHNDPALVGKVANLTTEVAELEKASVLRIFKPLPHYEQQC
ncbi:hypothetical protein Q9L58_010237 [Maublancomyces gigas]|uniref:Uncharacterized protein n=1 Tax=Discina gigas TaxID=1032678 RepID=A0ABR3G4Q6_9PEZI